MGSIGTPYTSRSRLFTRRDACKALAGTLIAAASAALSTGCSSGISGSGNAVVSGGVQAGSAAYGAQEPVKRTFFAFDTVITLSVYGSEELMDALEDRCTFFESKLSRTRSGSDIWNINHAQGASVEVDPKTAEVIKLGLDYSKASGGLFDITIGAVSSLWDFKEAIRPSDSDIAEALSHIDYSNVVLDGNIVTLKDPGAMLDLGGIAKGFIADDLASMIRDAGCESAIVNLGGNVSVVGSKPDGSPWSVGIQDPNAPASTSVIAALECADLSVVTSGLYERQFQQDGRSYHHILDPRTGFPAQSDLVSSSIAGSSSTEGDALATWMFLLGHDGALEHLEDMDGVEGLLIDAKGGASMTAGAGFRLR